MKPYIYSINSHFVLHKPSQFGYWFSRMSRRLGGISCIPQRRIIFEPLSPLWSDQCIWTEPAHCVLLLFVGVGWWEQDVLLSVCVCLCSWACSVNVRTAHVGVRYPSCLCSNHLNTRRFLPQDISLRLNGHLSFTCPDTFCLDSLSQIYSVVYKNCTMWRYDINIPIVYI